MKTLTDVKIDGLGMRGTGIESYFSAPSCLMSTPYVKSNETVGLVPSTSNNEATLAIPDLTFESITSPVFDSCNIVPCSQSDVQLLGDKQSSRVTVVIDEDIEDLQGRETSHGVALQEAASSPVLIPDAIESRALCESPTSSKHEGEIHEETCELHNNESQCCYC